jgi:hypothetical protein
MGITKTQRETRDFSMASVIKTHKNKTHQNNNKKYRNFFGRDRTYQFILGGTNIYIYIFLFYSLKKLFEEIGGGGGGGGAVRPLLPPSLEESNPLFFSIGRKKKKKKGKILFTF